MIHLQTKYLQEQSRISGLQSKLAATVSKNTDFLRIIEKYLDPLLDGLSLNYIPKHDLTPAPRYVLIHIRR